MPTHRELLPDPTPEPESIESFMEGARGAGAALFDMADNASLSGYLVVLFTGRGGSPTFAEAGHNKAYLSGDRLVSALRQAADQIEAKYKRQTPVPEQDNEDDDGDSF